MIKEQKYPLSEVLYFTSYGIFMVFGILMSTFYAKYVDGVPHQIMTVVCLGLLVLKELTTQRHSHRELFGLGVCLLLFLISVRVGVGLEEKFIAFLFLYIFCARNLTFHRIAQFTIAVTGIVCVFVVGSSMLGLIDNVVLVQDNTNRVRECLGFRYALYLPTFFMNVVALWICDRKEQISTLSVVALLLINWWIYDRTISRTIYVFSMLLLVAALVLKYWPRLAERLRPLFFLTVFSYPAAAAISLLLTMKYDSSVPWMKALNRALSTRLSLGKNSIEEYGFTLFGESIPWVGNGLDVNGNASTKEYTYVDCFYLQVLQHFGILFSVICMGLVIWLMYRCYKRREYYLLIAFTVVAAHCMLDDLAQYLPYNTFWLVAGPMLLGEGQETAPPQEVPARVRRFRLRW